jgi:hypothetical protein
MRDISIMYKKLGEEGVGEMDRWMGEYMRRQCPSDEKTPIRKDGEISKAKRKRKCPPS